VFQGATRDRLMLPDRLVSSHYVPDPPDDHLTVSMAQQSAAENARYHGHWQGTIPGADQAPLVRDKTFFVSTPPDDLL
jgi:hypothetical protein